MKRESREREREREREFFCSLSFSFILPFFLCTHLSQVFSHTFWCSIPLSFHTVSFISKEQKQPSISQKTEIDACIPIMTNQVWQNWQAVAVLAAREASMSFLFLTWLLCKCPTALFSPFPLFFLSYSWIFWIYVHACFSLSRFFSFLPLLSHSICFSLRFFFFCTIIDRRYKRQITGTNRSNNRSNH